MTSMTARLRSIPTWQITLGAALLGLGFLIAAQLAAQGPRVRYTTQERAPLIETATQLQDRQEQLKTRILELRAQIQTTEGAGEGSAALVGQLNDQLQQARIAAGLIPLTGTGIVLQLEDSQEPVGPGAEQADYLVRARDIRAVIEELWAAGAEAISVNDVRLTPTSAIRFAGEAVLVDFQPITAPYRIRAIGNAEDLAVRFAQSATASRYKTLAGVEHIGFSFSNADHLTLPASAPANVRYARVAKGGHR